VRLVTGADAVLALVTSRPATLGAARLLCIDGRAGSGKSGLAQEVADLAGPTALVHTDDLCPGWDGLSAVPAILAALLADLADGRPGTYPRYDWTVGRTDGPVTVDPAPLVLIEGVGSGARLLRPWRTALVWLELDDATRRERALARDGDAFAPFWDAWASAEEAYLVAAADLAAADLTLRR
jgi:uridine kinase